MASASAVAVHSTSEVLGLTKTRRWNRRRWRRLARAPEAVAGRPVGRPLPASLEPPRAARRALRRRRSRAGALPRGHFELAAVQAGVRVVDPSVDLHARQPLGLRLNLVLLGPGAVGVQLGQVVTRVEPHTVPQLTVALGPQRLAQEVGALAEAHLRGVRHGGAHREELGAHAVHVAH
eukprot:scaffold55895_cov39-Phaeocystis_antarctica.AAC.1